MGTNEKGGVKDGAQASALTFQWKAAEGGTSHRDGRQEEGQVEGGGR